MIKSFWTAGSTYGRLGERRRMGKGARRSGLPDLRIFNADLGQARDRCAVPTRDSVVGTLRFAPPLRTNMRRRISDLRQIIGRWHEHFVDAELAHRQALVEGVAGELVEHVAVLVGAIAPVILAERRACALVVGDAPRQRNRQVADLAELRNADLLGLEKGLVDAHREPGVLFDQRAADADRVHDRKDAGLLEIGGLDRGVIGKQPRPVGNAREEASRRASRDEAVDLARRQHLRQRAVIRDLDELDVGRQVDAGALLAAGFLEPAAPPFDAGGVDAVFVLQNAAHPDIGGHLIFGQPDGLALEVLRARDAAVRADIDAAVTKQPRHKGRDRDVMRVAARRRHRVAAHRDFGDVEFGELEGAVERLFRLQVDRGDVATFDRRAAVEYRPGAVIVADGKAQLQGHGVLRRGARRANLQYY